jgi:perosamine synthetase
MAIKNNQPYCGPAGLSIKSLLGRIASKNVFTWFAGSRIYYTHKARVAIRQACNLSGLDNGGAILVPSYNCGSEIDPLAKSGAHLVPYRVDKRCLIDLDDAQLKVTSKTKALYITHYFGFPQPLNEIKQFCKINNLYLLEDCALALFSDADDVKLGTVGDVSFFSFVKTLPTLDGGALIVNNPKLFKASWKLTGISFKSLIRRSLSLLKSGLLRWSPLSTKIYSLYLEHTREKEFSRLKNSPKKNKSLFPDMPDNYYFDETLINKAMSAVTKYMMKRFDFEEIINRRRNNYIHLLNRLSGNPRINILFSKLPAGVCPLVFPIIVSKRDEVCAMLNQQAIDATAWWAGYYNGLDWAKYPDACFLKNNLIALPIHQDLSLSDLDFIAEKLILIMDKI